MTGWYAQWMDRWETRLAFKATNRVVRPFEWGLDWLDESPISERVTRNGHNPAHYFREYNEAAIRHSEEFFGYERPRDFSLSDGILRFRSPIPTPHEENDIVTAQWFPARTKPGKPPSRRAVVVLPHWNAPAQAHTALARGLAKLGIAALRISLPYHDYRMPAELKRADYAVSSNVGRTLHATRQAVVDVRACLDWLEEQGYERLGLVGTSLGSCYAYLVSAHDPRVRVNAFNHCSTHFADVVWTGLSTQHIRESLEHNVTLDELRHAWLAISPVSYLDRFAARNQKSQFIYTLYDSTFLPEFSRQVVAEMKRAGVDHRVVTLPCGHYTMGETPFQYLTGYHICSYLLRNL